MALPWFLARLLIKVVAPTVPELVSTIATVRRQRVHAQNEAREEREARGRRLAEIEARMAAQLQLIEQVAGQLRAVQKTVAIALRLAIAGLILSVVALAVLVIH